MVDIDNACRVSFLYMTLIITFWVYFKFLQGWVGEGGKWVWPRQAEASYFLVRQEKTTSYPKVSGKKSSNSGSVSRSLALLI